MSDDQDALDAAAFDRGFMAEHRRVTAQPVPYGAPGNPGLILCHEHNRYCGTGDHAYAEPIAGTCRFCGELDGRDHEC